MVEELRAAEAQARVKDRRGKESKFSAEDRVLILLKYYREYPTLFLFRNRVRRDGGTHHQENRNDPDEVNPIPVAREESTHHLRT